MKFAPYLFVAMLLLPTFTSAAERADEVIQEAIDLLTTRHLELKEPVDRDKVYDAVEQLRKLKRNKDSARVVAQRATPDLAADSPPDLKLRVSDFIDHTERYRDQVVTLPLTVRSRALVTPGHTLRELQGRSAQFRGASEEGNTLDILMDLPPTLEIPKVAFGDRVIVTFRCREGDLQRGNVAITIRRPERE